MNRSTGRFARRIVGFPIATLVLVLVTMPSVAVADTNGDRDDDGSWTGRFGTADRKRHDPRAKSRQDLEWSDRMGHQQEELYPPNQEELYPPDQQHLAETPVSRFPTAESDPSTQNGTLGYAQFALGGLVGIAIAAVAARTLVGRRRQPPLDAAIASSDADDVARAVGLLGDRFARQRHTEAAVHAYRAAIDADHPDWSPAAQVALAELLSDRGDLDQAQTLLQEAIASGHPR